MAPGLCGRLVIPGGIQLFSWLRRRPDELTPTVFLPLLPCGCSAWPFLLPVFISHRRESIYACSLIADLTSGSTYCSILAPILRPLDNSLGVSAGYSEHGILLACTYYGVHHRPFTIWESSMPIVNVAPAVRGACPIAGFVIRYTPPGASLLACVVYANYSGTYHSPDSGTACYVPTDVGGECHAAVLTTRSDAVRARTHRPWIPSGEDIEPNWRYFLEAFSHHTSVRRLGREIHLHASDPQDSARGRHRARRLLLASSSSL